MTVKRFAQDAHAEIETPDAGHKRNLISHQTQPDPLHVMYGKPKVQHNRLVKTRKVPNPLQSPARVSSVTFSLLSDGIASVDPELGARNVA